MNVHPRALAATLASLLLAACGHGPLTSDEPEGGAPDASSSSSSSGGGDSGTTTGPKPCDATGTCACFVKEGANGCCIGSDNTLSSDPQGTSVRIFNPSSNSGQVKNADISCTKTSCTAFPGVDGVDVECVDRPTVTCGCD